MARLRDLLLAPDLDEADVHALLEPFGFHDPVAVDSLLQRMCPDLPSRMAMAEQLEPFLRSTSESADPEQCLLQIDRIAEATGSRATVYHSLGADPRWLDLVCAVCGSSRALSDVLVLNPEYLDILADPDDLANARTLDDLRLEASRVVSLFQGKDAALNALRRMRRREYLRIGAREFCGLGSFTEVVGEISDLACALVAETLSICHESVSFSGDRRPDRFAVVAWGKLGARELNYSSDIDLALVWDTPGSADDAQHTAFYTRLAQSLVDALSRLSEEGRMYRVDLRLRPFGSSGPIGCSVAQFLNYYESWSEPWERQALIKARTIAGPPDLRERVDGFIQDFTFSRPLDALSVASILRVKERSESLRSKAGAMDMQVKHGWGGIRDVEFTAQLLQLVAGFQMPDVRAPATLDALKALRDEGLLSDREEAILASAYVFLRQVEHRLQLAEELPMQELPEDPGNLRTIALRMGYRDEPGDSAGEAFMRDYVRETAAVREIHQRLFRDFLSGPSDVQSDLARVLETGDGAAEALIGVGFRDPAAAGARLRHIVLGPEGGQVSSEPQRRFLQMLPELLDSLSQSPDADLGLDHLEKMAEATGSPLSFFRSIGSSRKLLDVFTRLAGSSEFLSLALVRHPEYIDMLSVPDSLARARSLKDLQSDLRSRVTSERSAEGMMNALRRFRVREFLRIGVRDVAGISRVTSTTAEISLLAESCIRVALDMATGAMPGTAPLPGRFAILGMGKLGGRELHYSSDVDLVCVYDGDGDETASFQAYQKCVRTILDILSRLTQEGRGFHVDLRLRPEGNAGMLALPLSGYRRYLRESVQAWERQTLVRARYVAGDRLLAGQLTGEMDECIWGRPLTADDLAELRHVKRRIENERSRGSSDLIDLKLGPGGILDIEFTVQMLQMAWGGNVASLRQTNTLRALRKAGQAGLLSREDVKTLADAYLFLRRAENRLQLYQDRSVEGVPTDEASLATFARRFGYSQREDGDAAAAFLSDLKRHTEAARIIHENVFFEADVTRGAWEAPAGLPDR